MGALATSGGWVAPVESSSHVLISLVEWRQTVRDGRVHLRFQRSWRSLESKSTSEYARKHNKIDDMPDTRERVLVGWLASLASRAAGGNTNRRNSFATFHSAASFASAEFHACQSFAENLATPCAFAVTSLMFLPWNVAAGYYVMPLFALPRYQGVSSLFAASGNMWKIVDVILEISRRDWSFKAIFGRCSKIISFINCQEVLCFYNIENRRKIWQAILKFNNRFYSIIDSITTIVLLIDYGITYSTFASYWTFQKCFFGRLFT